ncbi:neprilysin-4-like [Drosophila takahashii]|uniref:neprilysin-4-like n=1 Tax=Drosophila takahashii TaxID=29030 RepID=UPI001CF924DE|nr:neprilysin-4-like [Drosophila takahashii]
MGILYILLIGHAFSAFDLVAASTSEDDLYQDTAYMKELLRQAKTAEIESFMNQEADPCNDFYSFSCGNYARINPAPSLGVSSTGLFETIAKGLDRKILKMLTAANNIHETPEDKQVKHFYESCLRIERLNFPIKMKQLIQEFGKMPVLDGSSWQESDFDWLNTTASIAHRYGIGSLINVQVSKDLDNNERNRIYIKEQKFPLETRSMYVDKATASYRQRYRVNIQRTLEQFLDVKRELVMQTSKELIDFEVELAKGLKDDSSLKGEKLLTPTLDIKRLIFLSLGERISESDGIPDFKNRYQKNLLEVIECTPKRTVANYIYFRLIREFVKSIPGTSENLEKACVNLTKKFFAKNLDNMFYRLYNNEKYARDINIMWHKLKSTFEEILQSSPALYWIEPSTRNLTIAKLRAMILEVNNYADYNFTEEFAELNLQSSDYLENVRQVKMVRAKQMREMLHKPAKPLEDELSFSPANILIENTIKIPVALLQPFYLWSEVYPNAVMFGSLAYLIGHELIHGFDDSGWMFDAKGNFNKWWDERSSGNFLKRRECFTKQYGRYNYDGIQLKESTSQSENIADNGGMRLAYTAYRKWYDSKHPKDLAKETLPNLPYSAKQLFFISFAQSWCNDVDPKLKVQQVSTDTHFPGNLRVIGSLSNFDEFSKEFNCPAESVMNPREKCILY